MERDYETKNFEINRDSGKRVVKFGASKSKKTEDIKSELHKEEKVEQKVVVNDLFAKKSARENLKEGEYPRELKHQLSLNSEFENAFEKLEPGVKLGYLYYFSGPKLTASITNRIVKKIDRIIAGHGLNDCTCGQSKTLPNCDGSHKMVNKG